MHANIQQLLIKHTGADTVRFEHTLQSLWSGYGSIDRYSLQGAQQNSVIVKHVRLRDNSRHPRGWNTDLSHQRKVHSYQVETHWYQHFSRQCNEHCRVPQCLGVEHLDDEVIILLEDLDNSGYPRRIEHISASQLTLTLQWLAHFHARFMQQQPSGLWQSGTYWHLQTRPDEFQAMSDKQLQQAAAEIDRRLTEIEYISFVHGDAKLANFCYSTTAEQVAAVDFQYVGGGCGMKDVAYFISSALHENECEQQQESLLDEYFSTLKSALQTYRPDMDAEAVEACWRPLYPLAWTDFFRFLQGWSPGHWKIHSYSRRLATEVLNALET